MLDVGIDVITALKAPSRYIKYMVQVYFDGPHNEPTDITRDIISLDTLEEATDTGAVPFGRVTSNELDIELDNLNKQYSIANELSPYAGKLLPGLKVVVTYSVELPSGEFKSMAGGSYYTAAWPSSTLADTANLVCYDRLYTAGSSQLQRFPVQTNIAPAEAFSKLFQAAGFTSSDYSIDVIDLPNITAFWIPDDKLGPSLSALALATATNVFVDKMDKIRVKSISNKNATQVVALSDNDIIISTHCAPTYDNVYSGLDATYGEAATNAVVDVIALTDLVVQPGTTVIDNLVFQKTPVQYVINIAVKGPAGVSVAEYTYTDRNISIKVKNSTLTALTVNIYIRASVVATQGVLLSTVRESEVDNILQITVPFRTTSQYVKQYAALILDTYNIYVPRIELEIRAFPPIEINDLVRIISPVTKTDRNFTVLRSEVHLSGGLMGKLSVIVT